MPYGRRFGSDEELLMATHSLFAKVVQVLLILVPKISYVMLITKTATIGSGKTQAFQSCYLTILLIMELLLLLMVLLTKVLPNNFTD